MLLPGDMFIRKEVTSGPVEWKTFTVISIDHGQMPSKPGAGDGRPATVLLLCDGPRIVKKEFGFLKNFIKLDTDDRVPGP